MHTEEQFDLMNHVLPEHISLQMLSRSGDVVFEASGKWLHPLFSLEHFLATQPGIVPSNHVLHDRIAGKAAAALTSRLGFTVVKADLISLLALELYHTRGIEALYESKVDRISCMTENLLEQIDDIEQIYTIIDTRRKMGQKKG